MLKGYIRRFLHYINLEGQIDDFKAIHASIEKDVVFKGTNLWILVFAIVVASVGLNMNSTAVIIGAMLISPLMGPINGMGYGLATYNFDLFRRALKNFLFAVIASLVASTAYFLMTPISVAHSELLARTSPSIYDVLIAFFGGMAGIVAISSKLKGNVIPGVAIATALMPPLCTAGYGLATAQFSFFLGAFYLFAINTVFIALASVVVCQLLGFPITTAIESSKRKRINAYITLMIVLVAGPSFYFGYKLVQQEQFAEQASRYIANVRLIEDNFLMHHEIIPDERTIKLTYGGAVLDTAEMEKIRGRAADFSLEKAVIRIEQVLNFDKMIQKDGENGRLIAENLRLQAMVRDRDARIDSLVLSDHEGNELLREMQAFFPQIRWCQVARGSIYGETEIPANTGWVVVLSLKPGGRIQGKDRDRLIRFLQTRLGDRAVRLIVE